jgi:hypothetical protein
LEKAEAGLIKEWPKEISHLEILKITDHYESVKIQMREALFFAENIDKIKIVDWQ